MRPALTLLPVVFVAAPAWAALPSPAPLPPAMPVPRDRPYPGQIALAVDATDVDHRIMHVVETIPAVAGEDMILLFPKWRPGNHGPTGPLPSLAGLTINADGKAVNWTRDTVDVGAFHVDVPHGAAAVTARFDFLSSLKNSESRVVMTANMAEVEWRPQVLFPAGYYQRNFEVAASVRLPRDFQSASALDVDHAAGGEVFYKTVDLETLLDSPVLAGRYFARIDLDPGARVPVHLDVVADRANDLAIKPDDLAAHRALVQQAYKTYASHHYNHYDILLSLSDEMGGIGLEHQRSCEVGTGREYFTDPAKFAPERDLLPHEYSHSWNGKFRRPADLWSPDEHTVPERDDLLWVYEGQTEYWGRVLAARSGIMKIEDARDLLAHDAALLDAGTPGRSWRNLQDTTNDPIIAWQKPGAWTSWSRFYDYYPEAMLIWLDADTLIREKSGGRKSLSNFARSFVGVDDGDWTIHTYGFDDVTQALNAVQPYDWAAFLRARLDGHGPGAPLDGITRGGWKLIYSDTESALDKAIGSLWKGSDFTFSAGLAIKDGEVVSVLWGGPAFTAGLAPGNKIIAVNGLVLDDAGVFADAITAAKGGGRAVELVVQDAGRVRTVTLDYHGGLRYPHLARITGAEDRLSEILAALR